MLQRVNKSPAERLLIRLEIIYRYLHRRRAFWLRCLLCWVIGLVTLTNDETTSYDTRFQLRGDQKASRDIVIVTIKQSNFEGVYNPLLENMVAYEQLTDITDSFFWNKEIWQQMLSKILQQSPQTVGVTLYFGDNIGTTALSPSDRQIFHDPRIFWSSTLNSLERILVPVFANRDRSNLGSNEIKRDEDGIVRRVFPQRYEMPHLVERMTGESFPQTTAGLPINFRGRTEVFKHYTLSEIMYDEVPADAFKDKIVLIGAETSSGPQFLTPLGTMGRSEILAHVIDNIVEKRWIKKLPFAAYALVLFAVMLIAVFLITTYPQSVAVFFLFWVATLFTALSAWVFDSFQLWFPAFSTVVVIVSTWIIFIGYQATRIERANFKLQQEQQYLQELEQLKNNFVSLISHDLKTPIAKIQSIVDRIMLRESSEELRADLKNLRANSEELNRYIQSILKVLRVESRDFKLHKEVADINELIEEAIQYLQPLAWDKGIRIETQLEPLFSSEFDVTLMKEVIINIIENAIKYTPQGGQIFVASEEKEDRIYVKVKDTGEGIKTEDLEKIWQKFTRGSDQDMKTKGSGLGLYLVKYFIELHGGKVNLTSQLGKGTEVTFDLPVSEEELG